MIRKILLIFFVVFLCSVAVLAQRSPAPPAPGLAEKPVVADNTNKPSEKKRTREGTTFQGKRVFFRQTGNRTTLYTIDSNERFVCLENLNLERILKSIEENPDQGTWKIDGVFTEFRGENYVLIQRSVISPTDFSNNETPKKPDNPK
jgi:hypothetical protein